MEKTSNRREFHASMVKVFLTISGTAMLGALAACSDDKNPSSSKEPIGGGIEFKLSESPELQTVGGVKNVTLNGTPAAIIRVSDTVFKTLSRVCTHQGCTVAFQSNSQSFDCACHGSRFDKNGGVLQGPATLKLPEFKTEFNSSTGVIKITT